MQDSPLNFSESLSSLTKAVGDALASVTAEAASLARGATNERLPAWAYLCLLGSRPALAGRFKEELSRAEDAHPGASPSALAESILQRYADERLISKKELDEILAGPAGTTRDAPQTAAPRGARSGGCSFFGGAASAAHLGGFLWKPISDSDGNLAILLPDDMTGKVEKVEIKSPGGSVLARGKFSGVGNGGREHYRFTKPGGSFPDGSKVVVTGKDGSRQEYLIKETSARMG